MSEEEPPHEQKPGLKLLIELGPIASFYLTYMLVKGDAEIFWAMGVFMVTITLSVITSRRLEGRWPTMALITAAFVVVLGAIALTLQARGDQAARVFIYIKPTLVNSLFALILLGGLATDRLFLKFVFGDAMQLEEEGWRRLTVRFGIWFVFLAGLNEVVWRNFSEPVWVNFKFFGLAPLTMIFFMAQVGLLKRYEIPAEEAPAEEAPAETEAD